MAFVSVTRLRLRSWRFVPAFLFHAARSQRQSKAADGNLTSAVLNDARWAFWTVTTWRDEAAMRGYMLSGAHKAAMPKLMAWCDEAATLHWTQDSPTPPTWAEAHARLVAEGRRSKVRFPSQAHLDYVIPAPRGR
jgi:quinol monooxygenase YgiN